VFSVPLTHGLHETHSATEGLVTSPRPITALGALRYADVFASGSWDGTIRLWKVERTLRSFSLLGEIAAPGVVNTLQLVRPPAGSGVGEEWAAAPDTDADAHPVNGVNGTGKPKPPVVLVAALAREPRLGRWLVLKEGVQNRAMVAVLSVR
jgi:ribosomal RNA-processing protein 9